MKSRAFSIGILAVAFTLIAPGVQGDTLKMKDGTLIENCFVRDDGMRFIVWESLDNVGSTDYRVIPRSATNQQGYPQIDKGPDWDKHPQLPDLTITFIEMNPKLVSFHARVNYDSLGRPTLGGTAILKDIGDRKYLHPEEIAKGLKLEYKPGETITFTAHIKNAGFVDSKPFSYRWLVDDKEVSKGSYDKPIKELAEVTFQQKYKWKEGFHTIGFEIITGQKEIATINNKLTDAMRAFGAHFMVNPDRCKAWHQQRSAYGNFSWVDYYRWHLEIMNLLFEYSIYPSAPKGIIARMRLDKISYLEDVNPETHAKAQNAEDGMPYHQAFWIWNDTPEQKKGDWSKHRITQGTEWSLPHELGHQLGIVDYYAVDYAGDENHVWDDNGEQVKHINRHPLTMMSWHGPHPFNEVDAMYLNNGWNKPRGHFGDYYFAIPDQNYLHVQDMNGKGVSGAKIEIFQRGVVIDKKAKPVIEETTTYYPVVEDGNFFAPNIVKDPVIVGQTGKHGYFHLPNRPADEVKTFNGYHRKANPFGNINVVGNRGLMLMRITKDGQSGWYWLEANDFNIAFARGFKDKYIRVIRTPYGSVDSPNEPLNVKWEYTDNTKQFVRVSWDEPKFHDQNFIEWPVGYNIYRRIGTMSLDDRPWFPVGTVNRSKNEFVIDLKVMSNDDVRFYSMTNRFGVTTVGEQGIKSGIVQASQTRNQTQKQQ